MAVGTAGSHRGMPNGVALRSMRLNVRLFWLLPIALAPRFTSWSTGRTVPQSLGSIRPLELKRGDGRCRRITPSVPTTGSSFSRGSEEMLESVDDAVVSSLPAKLGDRLPRREAGVENETGALINVVSTGTGVGLQEAERGTDAIAESSLLSQKIWFDS